MHTGDPHQPLNPADHLEDFADYFDPRIRQRALRYWREGRVHDLHRGEGPGEWHATVEGTDDYNVTVQLEDGYVEEIDCDCPYSLQTESYCKHVGAALIPCG
ncbi:MAG: SWIM zinc finger family protein [Bifidobacterium sp.]|nr:SWIM zinc finger family protein [Bifidobacterium sp.]